MWLVLAGQEVITQYLLYHTVTWGMLYGALFALPAAGLFVLLSGFWPKVANRILKTLFMFGCTVFFCAQRIYFDIFKTFLQVFSIGLGAGNLFAFFPVVLESLSRLWWEVLVQMLPFVIYQICLWSRGGRPMRVVPAIVILVLSVAAFFGAEWALQIPGKGPNTPYEQYFGKGNLLQTYQKLGVLTSLRLDAQHYFFGKEENNTSGLSGLVPESSRPEPVPSREESHLSREESTAEQSAAESVHESSEEIQEPVFVPEPRVLDIDFDHLIETAPNQTIADMHRYFRNVEPTYTNEYTGMFEGYNLIWIIGEAFSKWVIDEERTPTLYKMATNGFVFNNFYTPYFAMSTTDGEYVTMNSLIPKEGVWSYYLTRNNQMPFGFGNMFSARGYLCYGYHNNDFDMYRRDLSHPNVGYIWKAYGNGLNVTHTWPESDLEMMELTVPEYVGQEPFHIYYITVSGHCVWDFTSNAMSIKHQSEVENLPINSLGARAYLAANMEVELAMESLLKQLEEAGVADHTVIALSADHYPYGLNMEQLHRLTGEDLSVDFELYQNAFILYCPGMEEPVQVDKLGCSMDIAPTLANLFNLPVDSRFYMGRDLLSDSAPLVVMADKSFFDDKMLYNASTGEVRYYGSEEWSQEQIDQYLKNMQAKINNQFIMSEAVMYQDYYSYLQDYLPWWDGKSFGRLYQP